MNPDDMTDEEARSFVLARLVHLLDLATEAVTSRPREDHMSDIALGRRLFAIEILETLTFQEHPAIACASHNALKRVRELHKPKEQPFYGDGVWCTHCEDQLQSRQLVPYPCPTIKALEGNS